MQIKATDFAVSEIIGSILLLAIVVGVFSLLYIGVISYDFQEASPSVLISGSIEGANIVFEHRGGEPIGLNCTLVVTIGGVDHQVSISDYLNVSEVQDGQWNIGERVVYPVGDVAFIQVSATIIDEDDDYVLMSGILQEGEIVDIVAVTLAATEVTADSATLNMKYNFRNRTGDLRFAYREYTGGWNYTGWMFGQSGSGYYNDTITGLSQTIYYFKAELRYNLNITSGDNRSFFYSETELNPIGTYNIGSSPLGLSAQGSDLLDEVQLWYRYSPDNSTWGTNWWDTEWTARRAINLFVSTGATPSDYQVLLNISYDTEMDWNFSDLRFISYKDNTTKYQYWIENKTAGEQAWVWVRIDNSIIPQNETFIWMYYGNPTAASESNGKATFYFFDTFEGINLDVAWQANADDYAVTDDTLRIGIGSVTTAFPLSYNLNDGYILEGRVKYHNSGGTYSGSISGQSSQYTQMNNNGADATNILHRPPSSMNIQRMTARGSSTGFDCGTNNLFTTINDQWYILTTEFHSGGIRLLNNRTTEWIYGCGWIKDITYISLGDYFGSSNYDIQDTSYDWVLVRRWAANKPTHYIGEQEYIGWHHWDNPSNPDIISPWSWNFDFPEGAGFYEFYSISFYDSDEETHSTTADTRCYFFPSNPPIIITHNPNVVLSWTELNLEYDFKDFISGYVGFAYKRQSEANWHYTIPVARMGSGFHSRTIYTPLWFQTYEYKALLLYETTLLEGAVKTFVPPFG